MTSTTTTTTTNPNDNHDSPRTSPTTTTTTTTTMIPNVQPRKPQRRESLRHHIDHHDECNNMTEDAAAAARGASMVGNGGMTRTMAGNESDQDSSTFCPADEFTTYSISSRRENRTTGDDPIHGNQEEKSSVVVLAENDPLIGNPLVEDNNNNNNDNDCNNENHKSFSSCTTLVTKPQRMAPPPASPSKSNMMSRSLVVAQPHSQHLQSQQQQRRSSYNHPYQLATIPLPLPPPPPPHHQEQPLLDDYSSRSVLTADRKFRNEQPVVVPSKKHGKQDDEENQQTFLDRMLPGGKPCIASEKWNARFVNTSLIFTMIALVLCFVGTIHCKFLIMYDENPVALYPVQGLGMFREAYYTRDSRLDNNEPQFRGCISYDYRYRSFSGFVNLSRYLGAIAVGLLSLSFMCLIAFTLFIQRKGQQRLFLMAVRLMHPAASLFAVLTFSIFIDDTCTAESRSCELGVSGICQVVGVVFLLLATIMVFFMTVPTDPALIPVWQIAEYYEKRRSQDEGKTITDTSHTRALSNSLDEESTRSNSTGNNSFHRDESTNSCRDIVPFSRGRNNRQVPQHAQRPISHGDNPYLIEEEPSAIVVSPKRQSARTFSGKSNIMLSPQNVVVPDDDDAIVQNRRLNELEAGRSQRGMDGGSRRGSNGSSSTSNTAPRRPAPATQRNLYEEDCRGRFASNGNVRLLGSQRPVSHVSASPRQSPKPRVSSATTPMQPPRPPSPQPRRPSGTGSGTKLKGIATNQQRPSSPQRPAAHPASPQGSTRPASPQRSGRTSSPTSAVSPSQRPKVNGICCQQVPSLRAPPLSPGAHAAAAAPPSQRKRSKSSTKKKTSKSTKEAKEKNLNAIV